MKKVVVTGANGFVGSNVCKELSKNNITIIAVVKDANENIENLTTLQGVSVVYCDLGEIETLEQKICDRDIDVFFHFAWVGSAGDLRCDEEVQLKNALWTARALRTAHKLNCKKFVNAGTITEKETYTTVYEQGSTPPMPYIYGAGKIATHCVCKSIANSLKVDLCWAVITNTYGPGEVSPRLVNTTIKKLIKGQIPEFTSATQNYDFIYIDDLARAFVAIGKYGKANKEYVIGSGRARPLKEFLLEMIQELGEGIQPIFGEIPFTGVNLPLEFFNTSEIEKDCHFKPVISFAEGTRRTMEWIKNID